MQQKAMSGSTDRLSPGFSLYCDLMRVGAALLVLFGHASHEKLSGGLFWQLGHAGHVAVLVFFVLSGFIISYVAHTREASLADYSAARLARLYSVVIPAIIVTYVVDSIGIARDPSFYDMNRHAQPVWRALAAGLFVSQSWFADVALFSNSSYWSLPYEFWYYVIFGAALFLKGAARIAAIVVAALIAGSNILVLFPIWLMGVYAYRKSRTPPAGKPALLLFMASAALAGLAYAARETGIAPVYFSIYLPFAFSLADYVIAAGVALNLYAAAGMGFAFLKPFKSPIRWTAGMSFSLYLFHLPLMYCVATFVPPGWPMALRFAIMVVSSFALSALLSLFTESRKDALKDGFLALFQNLSRRGALASDKP
jgi:peptidoglycan/LPS O-acetylase OafA/YrhL